MAEVRVLKISNLKDKLIICLIFAVCLIVLWLFQVPCPIKYLTSIPCPGCGMSRAYIAFLHFDIKEAFHMHPMFWSMPVLIAYFFKDYRLFQNKWLNNGILILIGAGFMAQWIWKLFLHFA